MSTINVNGGSLSAQMAYLDAEAHHADDYVNDRNLVMTASNHNRPQFIKRQMTAYVNRQSARTKVEAYQIRQSFSSKELDYRNKKDRQTANELGQELAEAINKANGTNYPFIVATQADGKSHLLHNHIIFCNADSHGKPIPHGLSWFKVADLNDQITSKSNELLHFDEQSKLKHQKEKSDNNSIADSPLDHKFGKSAKNKDKPSTDDFKSIVNDALNQATSRAEFTSLLRLQRVYIAQRRGKEDTWEKSDGALKQSISLQYGNMHKRTKALTGLTLTEMERRFELNKQKQQRLQRTESQKVQETPAKSRQVKVQPQLQPVKQQKTMNPILIKLQLAKKQRSDWIKLHENEHDWQYDPEYIQLNSKIKHYERDLVAPSATAQGWKTMIATQKAIRELKKKEEELIDEPPDY